MFSSQRSVKVLGSTVTSRTRDPLGAAGVGRRGSRPGKKVTANVSALDVSSGSANLFGGSRFGGVHGVNDAVYDDYLEGIIVRTPEIMQRLYKEIYFMDSVAGSAVDLMTSLPFSDFQIVDVKEKEAEPFAAAVEKLRMKELLGEIAVDYLVSGSFIGTLVYDEPTNEFRDIIPYERVDCRIFPTPLYGTDPLIKVRTSQIMRNFVNSEEEYFQKLRKILTPALLKAFGSGSVTLDPVATMFTPRKTFTNSFGTSSFLRIAPIYLMEKMLYKGTMTEVGKRQRAILHLLVGSDEWQPNNAELDEMIDMFQQADLDPTGAVIATRPDVQTSELRPGGDFWKLTDVSDITTSMKLRALGISETFLTGEGTYATMEVSLNVFIEQLQAFREMVVRKVLYRKLFPLIAITHGMYAEKKTNNPYKSRKLKKGAGVTKLNKVPLQVIQKMMADTSELLIPTVEFTKNLRPQADRDVIDVLSTLSERGIPVPIKTWAAAGGISLTNLEEMLKEDKRIRELIAKYQQQPQQQDQYGDYGGGGGGGYGEPQAPEQAPAEQEQPQEGEQPAQQAPSDQQDQSQQGQPAEQASAAMALRPPRMPLLARDFGEAAEVVGRTKTGKRKYLFNQRAAQKREDEAIAKALANLSDPNHYDRVRRVAKKASALRPMSFFGR